MARRGLLIILSSPSGAGKSTLARRLMAWDQTLRFSVSATTRPARAGEVDGTHYYFVSEQAFANVSIQRRLQAARTHEREQVRLAGPGLTLDELLDALEQQARGA